MEPKHTSFRLHKDDTSRKNSPLSIIPFAKAKETSVKMAEEADCKADVFIDDIITLGVDVADNLSRITAAPCTVILL